MKPAERAARLASRTGITAAEHRALTGPERRLLVAWHLEKAGDDDGREWWPWAIRRLTAEARLRLAGDAGLDALWTEAERRRVARDVVYFTQAYGHLQPPTGEAPDPFLMWPEQIAVLEQMTWVLRLIVLKARQLGLTWLALHYAVWLQAFNAATVNAKILCLSKNGEEAGKLLARGRRIVALLPPYLRPDEDRLTRGSLSRFKLAGRGTMSSLTSTPAAARSETARLLLFDEAAFARNRGFGPSHTAAMSTLGAVGQEFVLSTGNGPPEAPGDGQAFAELWTQTRAGANDFVGVFLPTSVDPDRDAEWREREKRNYLTDEAFYAEHPMTEDQALLGQQGDKVYSPQGLTAAAAIGKRLDAQRTTGKLAAPNGGLITCVDWGESTHALVLWPLERGGFYVTVEIVCEHLEPGESTNRILGTLGRLKLWPGADKALEQRKRHKLTLVTEHRFDGAGIQSERTFDATARRHHPGLKITGIAFNAYKRETTGYLRRLVRRAGYFEAIAGGLGLEQRARIAVEHGLVDAELDHELQLKFTDQLGVRPTQILALGAGAPELLRQMRGLEWPDDGGDMPIDGDDHGPDALIAGVAPTARRFRDLLKKG